ncbi:hypothetical protein GGX14DRAFT_401186 [Mycena pura]|uniref:Uncharacterized protein n=1 Tax=Mycena pura TaxID=153505 RepID=A0AAD6YAN3_9AGAR|nr:hypothetical protein GGX14DRAFT_401186 [Mycena pura]
MWHPMVLQLMMPIFHMCSCSIWDSSFPILHKCSLECDSISIPTWKPLPTPKAQLAPVFILKTPLKFEIMLSPVTKANHNEFTNIQRGKAGWLMASNRGIWLTINLQMDYLHMDRKAKLGEYVKIGSKMLGGQALRLVDKDNKLLSLLFTLPSEYHQLLSDAAMHICTCMPGEFQSTNSQDESFEFLACHYSWYAWYSLWTYQAALWTGICPLGHIQGLGTCSDMSNLVGHSPSLWTYTNNWKEALQPEGKPT